MRLNSIQISGFKSFPERSELAFDGGVTAIVGPNGCGKSNVIDAISWVLGEQSARSLRGERMEDIIFSGSDARRPTATAEVRLQLSQVTAALAGLMPGEPGPTGSGNGHGGANGAGGSVDAPGTTGGPAAADAAGLEVVGVGLEDALDDLPTIARDVEVGRRLYRSGESEYLIDGRACRLRDIQDLLMDSGVGVKSYAVIEQGKIGQILSARPMERRQLIEGAAGVTKYKTRRRSAELKLEAAQQNLTRVDDIVFELEKQRAALKRQAAKARRYRRLREELRVWEKVHFARTGASLFQAIDRATQRYEAARQREHGSAAQLAALESTHQQLQIELAEAERGATVARDAAHAHELEVGRRQQRIEFDKQQIVSVSTAATDGAAELGHLRDRLAPLEAERRDQASAAEQCRAERDVAADHLRAAETAYDEACRAIEGLEGDVEASRSEVFAAIHAATALKHVVDNASDARVRLAETLTQLETESIDLDTHTARAETDQAQVASDVARSQSALESIRLRRADREAELASARAARESKAEEVRLREQALASLSARLKSIEELIAGRKGYSDAARLVLSQPGHVLRHLGSVADHLETDRDYERAVEASLSELVQYVVVPTSSDARAGMALAVSKEAGRCGFVVVEAAETSIEDPPPHPDLTALAQFITVAPGEAFPAVRGLLRHRWYAPTVEAAAAAARTTDDPITTPDGTVFRGPALLHGGGTSGSRGILAIKGETRELMAKLAAEKARVTQLDADVMRYGSLAVRAEAEVKTLQAEEHATEKALLELELRRSGLEGEMTRLVQKRELIETERRKAEEEGAGLDARQTEAREAIARLEAEQRVADERFMHSQRHLLEAREAVGRHGQEVTDAKAAFAALAERAAALAADAERLHVTAQELEQRIASRAAENQRLEEQRQTLGATVTASEAQLDEDIARFESLRGEVRTNDQRADDVRTRLEAQVADLRDARAALEAVRAEVSQLDVRRATAQADLDHVEAACQESLQLSLDQVSAEVEQLERDGALKAESTLTVADSDEAEAEDTQTETDELDASPGGGPPAGETVEIPDESPTPPTTAEEILARLRDKIDRLGPVNMMAIDQFDELEERFEFLTTQRKDLLDSIQATGDAIKRIDTTTRERFQEAFTAVNEHFQEIFATLFGGGRAGLVLLDEADLLESGIDIIAQPPGKRLQSIQLLSGGEKALTAMALMFAIFKFRPSPFCLLDEIDAPLDDANIGRFVEMLRGMQDHTQFVLVTHNRKTMEIADRLYGVTMEEPGVSKLISVQLN